ncbi:MAG TPA: hypothetical protein VHY79_02410 [Rhizomicrobium sp.]|jgi:hypothetical protein|nr:hypothetical protein [Rhizomicrobium sp.]
MKYFAAFVALTIVTTAEAPAGQHDLDPLLDYSACTARAAVRLDDGRADYAPIARAVAAACRDSYRVYTLYMARTHPAQPVPGDRDLAISAVQYERKYGPAPLVRRGPR